MTLSIVAKDEKTNDFGVCGFTDIAGYGSLVPQVSLRGAVATQAYVNVDNGLKMMELLEKNKNCNESGKIILNEDSDKEKRQMISIGNNNDYFEWTGKNTIDYKGSIIGDGFIIAGNCMKSKDVLEAAANYYCSNKNQAKRFHDIFQEMETIVNYKTIIKPIYKGFEDEEALTAYFSDHQIFGRYHKYRLRANYSKYQNLSFKELNKLDIDIYWYYERKTNKQTK